MYRLTNTYLDYNATTPVLRAVIERMSDIYAVGSNASSVHSYGRNARGLLEEARVRIARKMGIDMNQYQIIFTASGSEANNLAVQGYLQDSVVITAIEHVSVCRVAKRAQNKIIIEVDSNGIVKLDALEKVLFASQGRGLVSVMLANNETGVVQDIAEISRLVHKYNGVIHTDAAQGISKMEFDFMRLGVDMMTIASHKCGGPPGAAALIVRKDIDHVPMILGGGQENGKRAGTENVAAIYGFAMAVDELHNNSAVLKRQTMLRDQLEKEVAAVGSDVIIVSKSVERLCNTSCIIMTGVRGETQLINFDLAGIAISSGSACSSGKVSASHVLSAMGFSASEAECAIRVSVGYNTKDKDVSNFIEVWNRIYKRAHE